MEKPEPTLDEVLDAMKQYGGSFVKSLAETTRLADHINFPILLNAFSVYLSKYTDMVRSNKENKN